MAIKRLTNSEMYGFVYRWAGEQRALFAHDSLRHLLLHVDRVVTGFEQRRPPAEDEFLLRYRIEAATLDPQHDELLGLGFDHLIVLENHARIRQTGQAATWAQVRTDLWPEGKAHNLKSYFEEGAHTVAVGQWLARNPAVRTLLGEITLPGGDTLLKVVEDWIAKGTALYQVELQRRDRQAQLTTPSSPYPQTRSAFIKLVAGLRQNAELDAALPPEVRTALLDPLAQIEARADALRTVTGPDPEAVPVLEAPGGP